VATGVERLDADSEPGCARGNILLLLKIGAEAMGVPTLLASGLTTRSRRSRTVASLSSSVALSERWRATTMPAATLRKSQKPLWPSGGTSAAQRAVRRHAHEAAHAIQQRGSNVTAAHANAMSTRVGWPLVTSATRGPGAAAREFTVGSQWEGRSQEPPCPARCGREASPRHDDRQRAGMVGHPCRLADRRRGHPPDQRRRAHLPGHRRARACER